jgi:2-amino-4-hydroxy-6-hydroxymethyldihydropteridine diphosphokinase
MRAHRVYIGIGSNIGDKQKNLEDAAMRLASEEGVELVERSSFYETSPVGGPPQENYFNGVLAIETGLPPQNLLPLLEKIEKDMGRVRAGRNEPRVIDLDILLCDKMVLKEKEIEVPHPRMHERSFVLKGLAEIAPDAVHPVLNKTVKELYANNQDC